MARQMLNWPRATWTRKVRSELQMRDRKVKSPSEASDTITGASTNGWALWKAKSGKTLDELKRQSQA